MIKINTYLVLPGTAIQAIKLYKKVFNTEPISVIKFKDVPPQENTPIPTDEGGERVMHASFNIGNDSLMISDAPEGQDNTVIMGTQTQVSLHPENREEADRMFELLSEGGEAKMPMGMQFWGDYFGMCKDKFGVHWMINYHEENKK